MALGRKVIKSSLSRIWPSDLVGQVLYESRVTAKHFGSWLSERSKFRGKTNLKLNIGCGANVVAGWINIDLEGPAEVFRWDCRRSIPCDDESVDFIFAEHVFEHLDPWTGARFLSECKRCLRTGGTVRIVVPDAGKYLQLYQGDWSAFIPIRPLIEHNGKYRDVWLNKVYRTKIEFINEVFRQGGEHKYAYDAETLMMKLRDAGLSKVIHQSYGISVAGGTVLDTQSRSTESLYVEGIK